MGIGSCSSCSTSQPAPCFMAYKSTRECPKALGTCTHTEEPEEAPSLWLQTSLAPTIVAFWEGNQWV